MTRTLVQIATSVSRRLPLSNDPTTIVGNADPQVRQLLEILQEEGDDNSGRHEWSALLRDFTFTITANPHTEALPDDFDRFQARASAWRSGSLLTPLEGPVGPDAWQRLVTLAGTYPGYWRIISGTMQVLGVATGESVTIPYLSDQWIIDTNGVTTKNIWSADTDMPRMDDQLFLLGGRWRWKQSKGLEYAEDFITYENQLQQSIATDRTPRPISTARVIPDEGLMNTWPGMVIP